MVGQPEHPLASAFERAREWEADQVRQLTDTQRRAFDTLKEKQQETWQRQKDGIDSVRRQLEERAKNRAPKARLNLNPPVLIADPYIRRQARFVIAAEKRLEKLDRRQAEERLKSLKTFESERENRPPVKDRASKSWAEALRKTATEEVDRSKDRSDDFDKPR
jgi:hypothetical protein